LATPTGRHAGARPHAGGRLNRVLTLAALIGIAYALSALGGGTAGAGTDAMLLGFLLLAAYLAGQASRLVELPQITGYLVLGILVGPHVLGLLPADSVADFRLINGGALALIALAAGGELRLSSVRARAAAILSILTSQVIIVFGAVLAVVYFGRGFVPFLADEPARVALAVGMLFGLVAAAKSPATTIAVITEERASGLMTDTVLGVTVVKDVIILVLIALLIPFAAVVADPSTPFDRHILIEVLESIAFSIVGGLGVGWLLAQYLRKSKGYRIVVVLLAGFLMVDLSERLGLEYILIAMSAGFYVQNFSSEGRKLLHAIEVNSLPVYALFFAVAGADLRIDVLGQVWVVAGLVIGVRTLALFGSTYLGAALVGDPPVIRRYSWMGFLANAGVTLGIANIVRDRFAIWGDDVATVIIAMIAVNQLIGPPAFRFALIRAGESRRSPPEPSPT
jgi:Kef-type K+ transport system membrane component KefB